MSDAQSELITPEVTPQATANTATNESNKNHAMIAYVLMVVGLFMGLPWLIGLIWAIIKKSDAKSFKFYLKVH